MKVYVLMERTGPVKRISGVFGSFNAAATKIMGFDPAPDVEVAKGGPWQWGDWRIEEHEVQGVAGYIKCIQCGDTGPHRCGHCDDVMVYGPEEHEVQGHLDDG